MLFRSGEKIQVESIKIEGNTKTKSIVILRELVLGPGDVFDSLRMKISKLRLENTRFFEEPVNVTDESTNIPGRRNLKISIREARTGNLVDEAGFITTDDGKFGVSVDGLVDDDGIIEIKTMVSSDTLFTAVVARCEQLLELFRLTEVMHQRTEHLAYGKRRLLEMAIALACEPKVLLLDEPVAGVPAGEREELLQTVAALPAEVSVLLIEHDMDLVFEFADRITVLVNGAVLTEGTPQEIAHDSQVKTVYLGTSHD